MQKKTYLIFILIFAVINCGRQSEKKPLFAVTTYPIARILTEVTGNTGEIIVLVPPSASPHTYSPAPSDLKKLHEVKALFYVSPELDEWVAGIADIDKIKLIDMLPDREVMKFDGNITDPHFWTNPLAVKAIIPKLVEKMSKIYPQFAEIFKQNGMKFEEKLDSLDKEVNSILSGVRGKTVFLFHPSFRYLLKQYGLIYGGAIEESPGKEPSPKFINDLITKVRESGARAIFSEPQLPKAPAKAIAEAANVHLAELDPNGGVEGRITYYDLIIYNAKILRDNL